jgi:hypothetical protein
MLPKTMYTYESVRRSDAASKRGRGWPRARLASFSTDTRPNSFSPRPNPVQQYGEAVRRYRELLRKRMEREGSISQLLRLEQWRGAGRDR